MVTEERLHNLPDVDSVYVVDLFKLLEQPFLHFRHNHVIEYLFELFRKVLAGCVNSFVLVSVRVWEVSTQVRKNHFLDLNAKEAHFLIAVDR